MNRTIALLIPAILLAAMALIVFQQFYSSSDELTPEPVSTAQNAQGEAPTQPGLNPDPQEGSSPVQNEAQPGGGGSAAHQDENTRSETAEAETAAGAAAQAGSASFLPQSGQPQSGQTQMAQPQADQASEVRADQQAGTPPPATSNATRPQTTATQSEPGGGAPQAEAPPHKVESMKFEYQGSEMLFILTADSDFEYRAFALNSPERLVVDLLGNWSGVESINVPSNRLISGMRNGKTERGYRLVFDLKEAPKGHETKREGEKLTLRVY